MPTTTPPTRLERLADRHPLVVALVVFAAPLWSVVAMGGDVR